MSIYMLSAIATPIFGSLLIPLFVKNSEKIWRILSLTLGCLTCYFVLSLIPFVLDGRVITFKKEVMLGLDLFFIADGLSVFMAVVASVVGTLILFYSFGYVREHEHQAEFFFMVILFIGSMMGLVFSGNLILMYIFWELTAVSSWRLIGFYRGKKHLQAGDKAFIITFFGSAFMLLGMEIIGHHFGTFNLDQLRGKAISHLPIFLILLGIASKSAQFPIHVWLPDAGVAPTPVTALLHAAVLVKIGVYAFARIFNYTFVMPEIWTQIIPIIAITSAIVTACAALVETDMKRILAYSTISQIGYILLGFGLNTSLGISAALFFILVHAIGKAGLFLTVGIVERETHEKDLSKLGGFITNMPLTAISYFLCALSIIGVPPFGGFFSKLIIIMACIQKGTPFYFVIGGLATLCACLTMLYLLRVFNGVFLGKPTHPDKYERTYSMVFIVVILAVLSLLSGIFTNNLLQFIDSATKQIIIR